MSKLKGLLGLVLGDYKIGSGVSHSASSSSFTLSFEGRNKTQNIRSNGRTLTNGFLSIFAIDSVVNLEDPISFTNGLTFYAGTLTEMTETTELPAGVYMISGVIVLTKGNANYADNNFFNTSWVASNGLTPDTSNRQFIPGTAGGLRVNLPTTYLIITKPLPAITLGSAAGPSDPP